MWAFFVNGGMFLLAGALAFRCSGGNPTRAIFPVIVGSLAFGVVNELITLTGTLAIGNYDQFNKFDRMHGLMEPNAAGFVFGLGLVVASGAILAKQTNGFRLLIAWLCCGFCTIGLIRTVSRGNVIVAVVCILILVLKSIRQRDDREKGRKVSVFRGAMFILVMILLTSTIFWLSSNKNDPNIRLEERSGKNMNLGLSRNWSSRLGRITMSDQQFRFEIWLGHLRMSVAHPLGLGVAESIVARYRIAFAPEIGGGSHSTYLFIAEAYGWGGLYAYLLLLLRLYRQANKRAWKTNDNIRGAWIVWAGLLFMILVGFVEWGAMHDFKLMALFLYMVGVGWGMTSHSGSSSLKTMK
jgi:hypothetical protein